MKVCWHLTKVDLSVGVWNLSCFSNFLCLKGFFLGKINLSPFMVDNHYFVQNCSALCDFGELRCEAFSITLIKVGIFAEN